MLSFIFSSLPLSVMTRILNTHGKLAVDFGLPLLGLTRRTDGHSQGIRKLRTVIFPHYLTILKNLQRHSFNRQTSFRQKEST